MDSPERVCKGETGLAKWQTSDLSNSFVVHSSLPQDTPEQRKLLLGIIDSECIQGADVIGSELWVGEYVIHAVPLVDEETGEVMIARRCVLPQPDSPAVAFVSEGILKSLAELAYAAGHNPPFDPPIKVKLVQRRTRRGRRTFKLVPV